MPGLVLTRAEGPVLPAFVLYRPVLAVVVQGAKRVAVGDALFAYGPGQALMVGLDVPAMGAVTRASAAEPFLGLTLELDLAALREAAAQVPPARPAPAPPAPARPAGGASPTGRAIFVYGCPEPVTACLARLVGLLVTPEAIAALHPLVMRELSYWMLAGPQGADVRWLVEAATGAPRILRAVQMLRVGYDRPLRVGELAAAVAMSRSSFHQNFKALTALTPLQYQKQLRLAEARRLPGGLRERVAVQPRVPPRLRRLAPAGCARLSRPCLGSVLSFLAEIKIGAPQDRGGVSGVRP